MMLCSCKQDRPDRMSQEIFNAVDRLGSPVGFLSNKKARSPPSINSVAITELYGSNLQHPK